MVFHFSIPPRDARFFATISSTVWAEALPAIAGRRSRRQNSGARDFMKKIIAEDGCRRTEAGIRGPEGWWKTEESVSSVFRVPASDGSPARHEPVEQQQ